MCGLNRGVRWCAPCLVSNRVVKEARFNPTSQKGFLARPIAGCARPVRPVVKFLSTVVKRFNDYGVAGGGIRTIRARRVIAGVRVSKRLDIGVVVVVVAVGVKTRWWSAVTNIVTKESGWHQGGTIVGITTSKGRRCRTRSAVARRRRGCWGYRGRARCKPKAAT